MKVFILCSLFIFSSVTLADVYRWTDANGKVHYSDKPVANAQDITKDVKKQNIDTGTEERKKVEQILRKENDADREFAQQQQNTQDEQRNARCNKAREYLRNISGRVQFIDDNGKMVNVSEAQRQQRVAEMEKLIRTECN